MRDTPPVRGTTPAPNITHRCWRCILFSGQMSERPDSPPARLGDVLALALDRAVGSSLDSLHLLRKSVRSYTAHQKARGVPLDGVMRALSAVLMNLEDERSVETGTDGLRDPELARQLRAWCSEDYADNSKNVA